MTNRKWVLASAAMGVAMTMAACEALLDVGSPETELDRATVFADDVTAEAAVEGIYVDMISGNHFVQGDYVHSIALINGMSADEYEADGNGADPDGTSLYENELSPSHPRVVPIWQSAYQSIYYANAVIEGLEASTEVTESVSARLEGEAKFMRAFNHLYLINEFGDVPLITTTHYSDNVSPERQPVAEVYQQIEADLLEAEQTLTTDYSLWSAERMRVTRPAAQALLARVYLYREMWEMAEAYASEVIESTTLYELVALNDVFLKNSREAIWQLNTANGGYNTYEGFLLNYFNSLGTPFLVSTPSLAASFEENDGRFDAWLKAFDVQDVTYYYPYKYKVVVSAEVTEYYMVLRLAEQYLIRAEARAWQDDVTGAQDDLNAIRGRAGLGNTTADTRETLLAAVAQERRSELFSEAGHRWIDLKRWGRVDAVVGALKTTWQSTDALFPIPAEEIENNDNLKQNPGYN